MTEAVIVAACRTAIGTARKGTLIDLSAFDLATAAVSEVVRRSQIEAVDIDDLVLGEVLQGGGDIARYAAIQSGLVHVPGVAHNRHCASGMAAVHTAAGSIRAGMDTVVIAGGAESVSTFPMGSKRVLGTDDFAPWMSPSHPDEPDAPAFDMSITVGWNAAKVANVTREEMDAWACRSHERALRSIANGDFADEIFPLAVTRRDGSQTSFIRDEHPRETTLDKLASLKVLHPEIEGFSITAGNASGLNDAAAMLMVVSDDYATAHGLRPLATIRSWASVGIPPRETGLGPVHAIPKALSRAGMRLGDVDLFEINEAFAAMCVATTRMLELDEDKTNVNGSGCSLGHPVAATGARMIVTMIHELQRRGGGVGVTSMCAGGGMGSATVLEVHA